MQHFLNNFKFLGKDDWEWLLASADERNLLSSEKILVAGEVSNYLFVILEGLAGVYIVHADGSKDQVDSIGPGAIIGLSSWLRGSNSAATVEALEATNILAIPKNLLNEKLSEDKPFSDRFMRSAATYLAFKLSSNLSENANLRFEKRGDNYHVDTGIPELNAGIADMKEMFMQLDRVAMDNHGNIPEEQQISTVEKFRVFSKYLNELIGDNSSYTESVRSEIGKTIQKEVLPFLSMTNTADRFYSKPRGYAGDYLTIAQIYENAPAGAGRIGPLIDRCFLNEPAAIAVKNRRGLLKRVINETIEINGSANILSLASGPAAEIMDVYELLADKNCLKSFLVDIDMQALAYVSDKRDKKGLGKQISLINSNIVYLATGRQELDIPKQNLIYSIGLIDYFADEFVVALLDQIYEWLAPGGRVVLGNFHNENTTKALMDHVLEWRLIHRDEDDMNRLFSKSKFNRNATFIEFEESGINMFAHCIKD